jgi:hypothetical protein
VPGTHGESTLIADRRLPPGRWHATAAHGWSRSRPRPPHPQPAGTRPRIRPQARHERPRPEHTRPPAAHDQARGTGNALPAASALLNGRRPRPVAEGADRLVLREAVLGMGTSQFRDRDRRRRLNRVEGFRGFRTAVATGPSRMAPAHCRHGWSVVVRTRSQRPRNGSRASTFVSAWASDEPNISPGGPSPSFTRLRAD